MFSKFTLALRGSANSRLKSAVKLKKIKGDRETRTIIKPFFKAEFSMQTDDTLILDGLVNISKKPIETVWDYFARLNKTVEIVNNAYKAYTSRPEEPQPNQDNLCTKEDMTSWYNDGVQIF